MTETRIPWYNQREKYSIPFDSMEKKKEFGKDLTADEKDLICRFDISLEQLLWRRMMLRGPSLDGDVEQFDGHYTEQTYPDVTSGKYDD